MDVRKTTFYIIFHPVYLVKLKKRSVIYTMNKKQSILKHKILHWKKLQIDTQTETFPYIVYTFILWQKIII